MNKLTIYSPKYTPDSKCWRVFTPFGKSWPEEYSLESDGIYRGGIGMFWGFVGNNERVIRQYIENDQPWLFSDMPYFGRWNGLKEAVNPEQDFYWHISLNDIHPTVTKFVTSSDRFDKHGIQIVDERVSGDEIILCPSSETITRWTYGCSVKEWIERTTVDIRFHTDRPIRVRHKPRKNGTSGPAAATVPFAEDIKNAYCVVTSASMGGVEALINGVPVIQTAKHGPLPYAKISTIEKVTWDRDNVRGLCNTLAYHQYSERELADGTALDIMKDILPLSID